MKSRDAHIGTPPVRGAGCSLCAPVRDRAHRIRAMKPIAAYALFLAMAVTPDHAQQPVSPAAAPGSTAASAPAILQAKPARGSDRRRAIKLYLASNKLFEQERFEEAMKGFERAAALDPSKADYALAAGLARSHAVTALIQAAAKSRIRGDAGAARVALAHALELDPRNFQATEHLRELGDDALRGQTSPIYQQTASRSGLRWISRQSRGDTASTCTPTSVRQFNRSSRRMGCRSHWTTASAPRRFASIWTTPDSSKP